MGSLNILPPLTVYQEFDRLLEEQSPIEAYIEWLDSMVDRCVVKVCVFVTVTQLFFFLSCSSLTEDASAPSGLDAEK